MTKQELRKIYKAKRIAEDPKKRLRLDDLMLLQFQDFDYGGIHSLLTYWPMAEKGEPNTHLFSSYLRHLLPGLRITYPVSDMHTHQMQAMLIDEDTVYRTNEWGITEPQKGTIIDPSEIDMVLVPMLICDAEGYRVGYGKGFYDRYLAQRRNDVVKMGLSYFEPVAYISDRDQFDVPLSFCITPQHIYEF